MNNAVCILNKREKQQITKSPRWKWEKTELQFFLFCPNPPRTDEAPAIPCPCRNSPKCQCPAEIPMASWHKHLTLHFPIISCFLCLFFPIKFTFKLQPSAASPWGVTRTQQPCAGNLFLGNQHFLWGETRVKSRNPPKRWQRKSLLFLIQHPCSISPGGKVKLDLCAPAKVAECCSWAQTCLGPTQQKKIHIKRLKTSRKGGGIEKFGPVLLHFHFSLPPIRLLGMLCLQWWKCGFGEAVGGISQGFCSKQTCSPAPSRIHPSGCVILVIFLSKTPKIGLHPILHTASNGLHQFMPEFKVNFCSQSRAQKHSHAELHAGKTQPKEL